MATKGTRKSSGSSQKGKQPTKKRSATATEIKKQREQATHKNRSETTHLIEVEEGVQG